MKLLIALVALLPTVVSASVSGDPLTLHMGPEPRLWISMENDDIIGKSPDDFWTAGFRSGLREGPWRVGAEYDILTDRHHWRRSDESTLTIGHAVDFHGVYGVMSVGGKITGQEGGQRLQDWWHRESRNPKLDLHYESRQYRSVWLTDLRYHLASSDNGYGIEPSCLMSTDLLSCTASVAVRFWHYNMVGSSEAWYFIAPTFTRSFGHQPSGTADAVADFYNEPTVVLGLRSDPLMFDFSIGIKGSYGEIGVCF